MVVPVNVRRCAQRRYPVLVRLPAVYALLGLLAVNGVGFSDERPGSNPETLPTIEKNGTYTNPIVYADYSDPDVIRVGNDFYMTASSFNCVPGLPILHSYDLVHWELIGYALSRLSPTAVFDKPQHGNGVWAPSIRYRNGQYMIFYGDPDYGLFMTRLVSPKGPWETPILLKEAKGWIDPCPFWDDDGNAYLVHAWAKSRTGVNSILTLHRMNPEGTQILDEGVTIFDGHERQPTIEGPKLYKRNGYYYIFAPAGGVKNGWQTVLRSKTIYGPYEDRIVMEQGGTPVNGPHQGAWIDLASGESWFLHFQDKGAYGRILHLQPMQWINDFPVIGDDQNGDGKGNPVARYRVPNIPEDNQQIGLTVSDEFDSNAPALAWQWQANPQPSWTEPHTGNGSLRLNCVPLPDSAKNFWDVPNLLLQKFPGPSSTVTTKIHCALRQEGETAGLLVMGTDYSYLSLQRVGGALMLSQSVCLNADKGSPETQYNSIEIQAEDLVLRVTVAGDAVCTFSYSEDGTNFSPVGVPFTAKPGKWIGAKVGLVCTAPSRNDGNGYADFEWFRLEQHEKQ